MMSQVDVDAREGRLVTWMVDPGVVECATRCYMWYVKGIGDHGPAIIWMCWILGERPRSTSKITTPEVCAVYFPFSILRAVQIFLELKLSISGGYIYKYVSDEPREAIEIMLLKVTGVASSAGVGAVSMGAGECFTWSLLKRSTSGTSWISNVFVAIYQTWYGPSE